MLTPPYHFSIVASPLTVTSKSWNDEILYRGSIPAARNFPFLKRLGLTTLVVLRKKPLKEGDVVLRWAENHDVEVKWIKADTMGEESLGMGKAEVGEVLKLMLNPAAYPLYIADVDGISHTTLVVACLRKLQGWHMDSIVQEMSRFEPDHDHLPLLPFLVSYLTTSTPSVDPLTLPPPPYPSWLWPAPPKEPAALTRNLTRDSHKSTSSQASSSTILPFPNPLSARRHPTMKLTFSPVPTTTSSLSRESTRRDKAVAVPSAAPSPPASILGTSPIQEPVSMMSLATQLLTGAEPSGSPVQSNNERGKIMRMVSFDADGAEQAKPRGVGSDAGHDGLSRVTTASSGLERSEELLTHSPEVQDDAVLDGEGQDEEVDDEDEDEEDEDEEDEDDEDEEDVDLPSLHISALDLAGYG